MKELTRAQLLNLVKPTKRDMEIERNRIETRKFNAFLVEKTLMMYQEIGEDPPGYEGWDDLVSPYGGD